MMLVSFHSFQVYSAHCGLPAILIVQKSSDVRIGKGGDEGTKSLECRHPHPPTLIPQQIDEDWREFFLTNFRRTDAGNRHENVRTRLPHTPYSVLAKRDEHRQLKC